MGSFSLPCLPKKLVFAFFLLKKFMKSFGRRTCIDQYNLDNTFLRTWRSIKEASDFLGYTPQTISKNVRGLLKQAHGYIWKYHVSPDLEEEFWIEYPVDPRFKVSSKGRIQTPTGKKTFGYIVGGYRRIRTRNVSIAVHRMVAQTFLEPVAGKDIVNHIDHNKLNNAFDNLEWVTSVGNARAAETFYNKRILT